VIADGMEGGGVTEERSSDIGRESLIITGSGLYSSCFQISVAGCRGRVQCPT